MTKSDCSERLFSQAKGMIPGGVSSPVRAFRPNPIYISRGQGSRLYDVDGNQYIDYNMAFGPLILGHARMEVMRALRAQLDDGVLYGAPISKEIELTELVRKHYPSIEMLRLVNSGTEATMHALRLARGHTGKAKFIKVEGAFHGAHDSVLVKAGSGATTHSAPNSLGVPEEVTRNTLLIPFNDLAGLEACIHDNEGEIAAMILEPVIGNAGPILPQEGYLKAVRRLTHDHGILLIFDEVITGFRLAMGGAQERFGVKPDITVLGKILGGGMPIGAFGASKEIMSDLSPLGKVYQAGTFSGNPMSLTAGIETIRILEKEHVHSTLEEMGQIMMDGLKDIVEGLDLDHQVQGIGSMFQLFFINRPVTNYQEALGCDGTRFMRMFHRLLDLGVYLPPSQWETNFISAAHSDADLSATLEAFETALKGSMT